MQLLKRTHLSSCICLINIFLWYRVPLHQLYKKALARAAAKREREPYYIHLQQDNYYGVDHQKQKIFVWDSDSDANAMYRRVDS